VHSGGAGVHESRVEAALGQGRVQPEAGGSGRVAGADWRIGRQLEACLGLGDLLGEPVEVAGRHRPIAGLLGRLRGTSQEPLVLAEFQSEVERSRGGRVRHGWVSVIRVKGVLPDGDLYHLRYLAAYMVSNEPAHLPGRPESRIATLSRNAGPVGCSEWILIMASS